MIKIPFGIKKKKEEGGIEEKKTVEMEKKTVGEREFEEGLVSVRDIIAPAALEVDFNHLRINNGFYRTLFISGYPAFVTTNWLSSLINFDHPLSVSMYIYPAEGKKVLDDLRRKIAEMEAELSTDMQRGKVVNPGTQAKLEDALKLQEELVKGEERFFQFGLYVAISAKSLKELDQVTSQLEAALGALLIISKKATLQMEEAFQTCLPVCNDQLNITRNMDTTALATTFPFVSSDLSDDKGIMYGINQHNGSLVIFDRFSLENANVDAEGVRSGNTATVSGSASSETHTIALTGIAVEGVSTSQTVVTPGSDASATYGTYTVKFDVTALEEDAYIGTTTATSGTVGVTYTIGGSTFTGSESAIISSTADRENGFFVIDEGETETFTLTVTLNPGAAGTFDVRLDTIRFNESASFTGSTTYSVGNHTDFRTDPVYIAN